MEMQGTQRTELKFNVEIIIIKKTKTKSRQRLYMGNHIM